MMEVLPLAIGVGLVVSLMLTELLGVASAGMVVPGYIALYLVSPVHVAATLVASLLTYGAVRGLGAVIILYGRRRTALAILLGYLLGAGVGYAVGHFTPHVLEGEDAVIGYIIPGLVAIWMDRQGVAETLGALTVCTALVRLVLVLLLGTELPGLELLQ